MKFSELEIGDRFNRLVRRRSRDNEIYVKTEWNNKPNKQYNAYVHKFDGLTRLFDKSDDVVKLTPYKVVCEWTKTHEVEVYAENLEDAIEEVNSDDGTLINTDRDGAYLDDSFTVNMEVTDELNDISTHFDSARKIRTGGTATTA